MTDTPQRRAPGRSPASYEQQSLLNVWVRQRRDSEAEPEFDGRRRPVGARRRRRRARRRRSERVSRPVRALSAGQATRSSKRTAAMSVREPRRRQCAHCRREPLDHRSDANRLPCPCQLRQARVLSTRWSRRRMDTATQRRRAGRPYTPTVTSAPAAPQALPPPRAPATASAKPSRRSPASPSSTRARHRLTAPGRRRPLGPVPNQRKENPDAVFRPRPERARGARRT